MEQAVKESREKWKETRRIKRILKGCKVCKV